MSQSDEILSPDIPSIPTPVEHVESVGNGTGSAKNVDSGSSFAQEMTDAIYGVHAAANDVVMGNIVDASESAEATEVVEAVGSVEDKKEVKEETKEEVKEETTSAATEAEQSTNADAKQTTEHSTEQSIATQQPTEQSTTEQSAEPTEQSNEQSSTEQATASNLPPHLIKEQLKYCQRILKGLKRHRDSAPFLQPVDPVALNIPDYPLVIKHPMDLSTISKKFELSEYSTAEAFIADVRLMLNNCFTYNAPESGVAKMGRSLEKYFNSSMARMPASEADLAAAAESGAVVVGGGGAAVVQASARQRRESKPVGSAAAGRYTSPETFSFCSGVLRELMKKSNSHLNWPFMVPVDPVALNIPDYLEIIKHPMDLSTVRKKLDSKIYTSMEQFEEDVRLMFSNCYTYNPPESDVHKMGRQLEAIFDAKWAAKPAPKAHKPATERRSSSAASAAASHSSSAVGHAPASTPASASASASSFHSLPQQQLQQQLSVSQLVPGFDSIEDDSEKILAINYQIQILQAELNNLLLKRKGLSGSASAASSSNSSIGGGAGAASATKPRASSAHKKKSSVTSPLQAAAAASTPAQPSTAAGAASATSATVDPSLPKPFSTNEMTFEEKKKLSEDVNMLTPEQLMRVLDIIERCMPNLHKNLDSDVIELDIEALDTYTLRVMQAYIWECMNPGKKRRPSSGSNNNSNSNNEHQNTPAPKKEKLADGNGNASVVNASTDDESSSDEE